MRFQKFISTTEQGRTLLEMLAVIVIVGVLTVGGITANSIANRLFRDNYTYTQVEELIGNIVDSYSWHRDTPYKALTPAAVCENEFVADICDQHNNMTNIFGGQITISTANNYQTFLVTYRDVPIEIRDELENKPWRNADIRSSTCDEKVCSIIFTPKDSLQSGDESESDLIEDTPCRTNTDCDLASCDICVNGICVEGCGPDEVCVQGGCQLPSCTTHEECNGNSVAKYCLVSSDARYNICVECLKNTHCNTSQCLECINNSCQNKCNAGEVCSSGHCVMASCSSDSDCYLKNPRLPYCHENDSNADLNKCVECRGDTYDTDCDTTRCYGCQDFKCVYKCADGQVCINGTCKNSVCQTDADCTEAGKPYCQQRAWADDNRCVECKNHGHCDLNNCQICGSDNVCMSACDAETQYCDGMGHCQDLTDTVSYPIETYETTTTVYDQTPDVTGSPDVSGYLEVTETGLGTLGDPCSSNADCQPSEGLYCNYDADTTSCTVAPTNGVCKSTTGTTKTVTTTAGVRLGTYIKSSDDIKWWSAVSYCEAVGGRMATVSDFGCGYDFIGKVGDYGYCNAADSNADGQTLSDNMKAFMSAFGSSDVWTSDLHTLNTCYAYYAYLYNGHMAYGGRTYDTYTLCRVGD